MKSKKRSVNLIVIVAITLASTIISCEKTDRLGIEEEIPAAKKTDHHYIEVLKSCDGVLRNRDSVLKKCGILRNLDKGGTTNLPDKMPEFPGGSCELFSYLGKAIKYPSEAKEEGTSGTVIISFIVSKTGDIKNVKIAKGVSEELDNEAIRVIKKMPKWIPGENSGEPADVSYNLPIRFKLN